MTPPVAIAGLGLSGLGCALELTRRGVPFIAFEKESRPGGLARSEAADGFRFDHGPHIVLGVPPALRDVLAQVPGLDLQPRRGRSCVALDDGLEKVVPVPFQRHLNHLPLAVRARLLMELAGRGGDPAERSETYAEYAIARCGRSVYDLFLHGYETKRLRFSLDEMPPDWTSRVPRPSPGSLIRPRWAPRGTAAESRFLYPRSGGIEALPRGIAALLPLDSVRYGHEVLAIDAAARRLTLSQGGAVSYERLVLGLPLPEVVSLVEDPPRAVREAAEDLVFTSIHVVSLGFDGPAPPWTLIRFPDARLGFYRLSFPARYADGSAPEGGSAVVGEISHHPDRHALSARDAREQMVRGLVRLGVLRHGQPIRAERVQDIRYGHIVYNHRTRESLRVILEYLNARSIHTCGKYGLWREMLMTDSMLSGMGLAADLVASGAIEQAQDLGDGVVERRADLHDVARGEQGVEEGHPRLDEVGRV